LKFLNFFISVNKKKGGQVGTTMLYGIEVGVDVLNVNLYHCIQKTILSIGYFVIQKLYHIIMFILFYIALFFL